MIHYLTGDATAPIGGGHKFIIHVCNDAGFWNKGFVLALSRRWTQPETAYRNWAHHRKLFELGNIQKVAVAPGITVFNMLAQRGIRTIANPFPLSYGALRTCLAKVAIQAQTYRASVHLPRIGSGLAGGDWREVSFIIDEILSSQGVQSFVYDLPMAEK